MSKISYFQNKYTKSPIYLTKNLLFLYSATKIVSYFNLLRSKWDYTLSLTANNYKSKETGKNSFHILDKSQCPIMIQERREIYKRNSTNTSFLVRWNILIGKENPKSLEILMRWRDRSEFRDTKEARVAGQSIRNKGMLRKSFRNSQEIPFESSIKYWSAH